MGEGNGGRSMVATGWLQNGSAALGEDQVGKRVTEQGTEVAKQEGSQAGRQPSRRVAEGRRLGTGS